MEDDMLRSACLTKVLRTLLPCCLIVCSAIPAAADSFTFNFLGTTADGSVNGTAVLTATPGSNQLSLVLTNNQPGMISIGQAISGFSFTVVNAAGAIVNIGPVAITSPSGREIDFSGSNTGVDLGGTNAADVMGWGLTSQTNPTYF